MSRIVRIACLLALACLLLPPQAAVSAQVPALPKNCQATVLPDGETYVVCFPPSLLWNRDLVIFAHGYEFAYPPAPPRLGEEQWVIPIGDGRTILLPELVNLLGFGFATTSYSKNGLAVLQGVDEVKALAAAVRAQKPLLRNVYIVGASEGGLVTTLSMERNADVFKGGLALCGPVGDFRKQINYWGDFRAGFDAFFPGLLPPDAVTIPEPLMADWIASPSLAQGAVLAALADPANASKVGRLLALTQAPVDPADPSTAAATTLGILTYNVLATNEARVELARGLPDPVQPYDNSANLALLAAGAQLYTASPNTAAAVAPYQTSGALTKALVNLHTTGDPIVPIWHQALYAAKAQAAGMRANLTVLPIQRYGHCAFKPAEILFAFAWMLYRANSVPVRNADYKAVLDSIDPQAYAEFEALAVQFGDPAQVKLFLPAISSRK